MKINLVKTANIVGTVLGIAGTLITGWSQQKTTKDTIVKHIGEQQSELIEKLVEKKVEETLRKINGGS